MLSTCYFIHAALFSSVLYNKVCLQDDLLTTFLMNYVYVYVHVYKRNERFIRKHKNIYKNLIIYTY